MKLRNRLILQGAVIPGFLLIASVLLIGQLFAGRLLEAVDRSLSAQVAVEADSLFDGPGGSPHLHAGGVDEQESRCPVALHAMNGALIATRPEGFPVPAASDLPRAGGETFRTTELPGGGRRREVTITLRSPGGESYILWAGCSLVELDRTIATYHRVSLLVVLILAGALALLQGGQALGMARRIARITEHMERVGRGDLGHEVPEDPGTDEIRRLRDQIADATHRLLMARGAMERLLAEAAHELRTPLATMRTGIEVVLRRSRTESELRESLERTLEDILRLSHMVNELLDISTLQQVAEERRPVDLVRLARETLADLEPRATEAGVTLRLVSPPVLEHPVIATSIRRALENLLANSLVQAPAGSTIHLELESRESGALVRVRDAGPGIPPELRESIFEPFVRASGKPGGHGLGLAIVREIARQHGGRARVISGDKGNTCFEIELG